MLIRQSLFVAGSILAGVTLLTAQGIFLAAGGHLEDPGVSAVATVAAAFALAGTIGAASRVPQGTVRTAWLLWSVGAATWLAGALAQEVATLTAVDVPLWLVRGLEGLFAVFGVAGLRLRAPSRSFSLSLFTLDALPIGFLTIALWTVLSDPSGEPAVTMIGSGAYLVVYIALALMSFQLMAIDGLSRVPTNMWILGPGFIFTAVAAVLQPGGATSLAAAVPSDLLSTAGLLIVGAAGVRRAVAAGSFTRLLRPHRESGVRAVPPAAAVVGLVTLLFVGHRDVHVLGVFLLGAVLSVGFRFYLARRELVRSQEELVKSEKRYRDLFENARDPVFTLDSDVAFTSANLATEITFDRACSELLGHRLTDFVAAGSREIVSRAFERGRKDGLRVEACEFDVIAQDGRQVQLDVNARAINRHGEPITWQCIGRDVTDQRRFVEELRHRAFHDSLTGLANSAMFADRVERALARPGAARTTAVLFIDLDGFKAVNDRFGHQAGDRFLVEFAARLKSCVRPSDICARVGGDEFAIALEDTSVTAAVAVADRILAALGVAVSLGIRDVLASVSVGIAVSGPGDSSDVLLRDADIAMYEAKLLGGGRFVVFEAATARRTA